MGSLVDTASLWWVSWPCHVQGLPATHWQGQVMRLLVAEPWGFLWLVLTLWWAELGSVVGCCGLGVLDLRSPDGGCGQFLTVPDQTGCGVQGTSELVLTSWWVGQEPQGSQG